MENNKQDFQHGGDIYTDGLLKGRELIDFSSNINPLGVPKSFVNSINAGLEALTRYPDYKYRELKSSIYRYLGKTYINEENLILGNGAAEVIDLVIGSFSKILLVAPSFVEYEKSAVKAEVEIEYSYLSNDMSIDYSDIYNKLENSIAENKIEAIVLGNPNNPNGGVIDKDKLGPIMKFCSENGIVIIVDEAFIEFTASADNSFLQELENSKNIFIIRALTKFFAMPGIRFGYGISKDSSLIEKIKSKQIPWNINCFAELAVKSVLQDEQYINKSLEWISEELPCFMKNLSEIDIISEVYESKCNFVLCSLRDVTGQQLYEYCLSKGIVIRRASNFLGLDDRFVRFAVKDRETNNKLINVLKGFHLSKQPETARINEIAY